MGWIMVVKNKVGVLGLKSMGRRKKQTQLVPINKLYPQDVCYSLNRVSLGLVPKESSSEAHLKYISTISAYWYFSCLWIAYEIAPIPDIEKPPYSYPIAKTARTRGELAYAHLKLTQACFEKVPQNFKKHYPDWTAWDWWVNCMHEFKYFQGNMPRNLRGYRRTKRDEEKLGRYILRALRLGKIPRIFKLYCLKHSRIVFEVAQQIRKELKGNRKRQPPSKFKDYWNLFINSLSRWVTSKRDTKNIMIRIQDEKLQYIDKYGHWQILPDEALIHPDPVVRMFIAPLLSYVEVHVPIDKYNSLPALQPIQGKG